MVWAIAVGIAIVLAARHFVRTVYQGRALAGFFGVSEDYNAKSYTPIRVEEKVPQHRKRPIAGLLHSVLAVFSWTLPGVELTFGQSECFGLGGGVFEGWVGVIDLTFSFLFVVIIVVGYLATVLICIVMKAELIDNPNRAGTLERLYHPS